MSSSHVLKNVVGSGSLVYLITNFLELSESCSDREEAQSLEITREGQPVNRCLLLEKNIYESLYFQSILIGITHLLLFPLLHPPVKTGSVRHCRQVPQKQRRALRRRCKAPVMHCADCVINDNSDLNIRWSPLLFNFGRFICPCSCLP